MNDKDPPPFGYTFNGFFDPDLTSLDAGSQSLLSDMEHQSLTDFFSNTDPFHLADAHAYPPPAADAKDGTDDFGWSSFVTPATVHRVSTTIPDQAHLHHGFDLDPAFAHPSLPTNHLGNTHDDLQAASTLFTNSQPSYTNTRPPSFHTLPSPSRTASTNGTAESSQASKPMIFTSHGLINEQLAAIIPSHGEHGTIDAQLAAQWAVNNAQQQHEADFGSLLHRPNLKRAYTFGTDSSFNNPSGYSAPHGQETEEQVTRRLLREMRHSQPLLRTGGGIDGTGTSPTGHIHLPPVFAESLSDNEPSEDGSSEDGEEDDRPAKKRRKNKYLHNTSSSRKSQSRNGKGHKASVAEEGSKKKRVSAASQKMQRENLTEEQKRSNHILSEQKRRNLIKRGFDDLHDLVPEIRNGGLSKSSVLMEAANFLEKVIQENASFRQLTSDVKVCGSE